MPLAKTPCRALIVSCSILVCSCLLASSALADRVPLVGSGATAPSGPATVTSMTGLITVVPLDSVPCIASTMFSDVAGGETPGTNYDGILTSGGLVFAESFMGQSVSTSGDFDVVSELPSGPLTPRAGDKDQNLDVFEYATNVLAGLGHLGFPDMDAVGEGAIAMYFPYAQSRVSFSILGGNGGSATLDFYDADGKLIDRVVLSGLGDAGYGFTTTDGEPQIAGVLIQNTDPSGIGIDDICHDSGVVNTRPRTWGGLKQLYR